MRRLTRWVWSSLPTQTETGEPAAKRKRESRPESETIMTPAPARRGLLSEPATAEKSSPISFETEASDATAGLIQECGDFSAGPGTADVEEATGSSRDSSVSHEVQDETKHNPGDVGLLGTAFRGDAFEGHVIVARDSETICVNFCGVVLSERHVVCGIMDRDSHCLQAWTSGVSVRGVDGTDGRLRLLELIPQCDLKISTEPAHCMHLVGLLEGSGPTATFRSHENLGKCELWELGEMRTRQEVHVSFSCQFQPRRTVDTDDGVHCFAAAMRDLRTKCQCVSEQLASSMPSGLHIADNVIAELQSREIYDDVRVLLLGSPGSGKSKTGNALLGAGILPAHGMGKSVTSAVIRIKCRPYTPQPASHPALYLLRLAELFDQRAEDTQRPQVQSSDQRRYGAEVTFLTESEWAEELELLIDDLCEYWLEAKGDKIIPKKQPLKEASCPGGYAAWSKLQAVYGESLFACGRALKTRSWESREALCADIRSLSTRQRDKPVGIASLGSTMKIEEDMPHVFQERLDRFVAQQLHSAKLGQYWPLVKEVNLFTPSPVLADGVVFHDCPGEGDSNPARDSLARKVRKDADLVWIFCRVERALDENIGQDLLRASMREIMLDHASENSFDVTFVAAKADQVVQSEVVQKLGLPKSATAREAALARRQYLKRAIVYEVKKMTGEGDAADDSLMEDTIPFHVFGISALDYHRLTGMEDNREAATFETIEETELPDLKKCLHLQVALRRSVRHSKMLKYADAELSAMIAQIRDGGSGSLQESHVDAVEERLHQFRQRVEGVVRKLAESAIETLNAILAQVQKGAEIGQEQAKGKAEWWGKASNSKHHATYAAIVRRHGRWCENGHDWPGEVAEPIYESFTKAWFDFFARGLANFFVDMEGLLEPIQEELYQDLRKLHPRCWTFRPVARKKFALCLKALAEATTSLARQQQREISSEVQTGCQVLLHDTFDVAKDMKGSGSHHRRKTFVERGAQEANYEEATVGVVQGISALQEQFRRLAADAPVDLLAVIRCSFGPLLGSEDADCSDACSDFDLLDDDAPVKEAKLALPSLELAQQSIMELSREADDLILQMRREQRALQPPLRGNNFASADPGDDARAVASTEEVMRFFRLIREAPAAMTA